MVTFGKKGTIGLVALGMLFCLMSGFVLGHYVIAPPPAITGSQADNITKYCYRIPIGAIPPPYSGFIPPEYRNGTYAVYSCKVA